LGRNNRSEDVVSEIISFALGERFESIVRPDDPQNGFHTASTRSGPRPSSPTRRAQIAVGHPAGRKAIFRERATLRPWFGGNQPTDVAIGFP
jgi:hypothetical protein